MSKSYFRDFRTCNPLRQAFRRIEQNANRSRSKETRDSVYEFGRNLERNLKRIERQIREGKFQFKAGIGIAIKKKSGGHRPLVIAPTESRVVQRSLLNTLTNHPEIGKLLSTPTSFGGIRNRGVREAIGAVHNATRKGNYYYIRSDIQSFFTKVSKSEVTSKISEIIPEAAFVDFLGRALEVELENVGTNSEHRDIFPLYDQGLAQGSCLSPLAANIALNKFDIEMNSGDINCFRYIDDFVILAPSQKAANAGFKRARKLLAESSLDAYEPGIGSEKAARGRIQEGLNFLGCDIDLVRIRPSRAATKALISNIELTINRSKVALKEPPDLPRRDIDFAATLNTISNILRGWGNQYAFCNDQSLMGRTDAKVDKILNGYLQFFFSKKGGASPKEFRRMLGVWMLTDSNQQSIISTTDKAKGAKGAKGANLD